MKLRAYRDELAPIIAAYGEVEIVIRPVTSLTPEPACRWCPNAALPGDTLCDTCRWLAGVSV